MLEHEHFILTANVKNCPSDPKYMNAWMKQLIKNIDMEIFMGPYSKYSEMEGNKGVTSVAIITTSHIALHFFNGENGEPSKLALDVYSCKSFDVRDVLLSIEEFEPYNVDYLFLERNDKIKNKNSFWSRIFKFLFH